MLGAIMPHGTKIKPLVIFGAGASFDLTDPSEDSNFENSNSRPPLTDKIFKHKNDFFKDIQNKYPRTHGLMGIVNRRIKEQNISLEEVLEKIMIDPVESVYYQIEMFMIRDYLINLFAEISREHADHTIQNNYQIFFKLMETVCPEYMVVNFNYDFLAQRALTDQGYNFENIGSYILNKVKLIHPHGSILWRKTNDDSIDVVGYKESGDPTSIIVPTITGKKFCCPQGQLDALQDYVMGVNVLIIVGWKGREDHFKKDILSLITDPPKRIIIAGGPIGNKADRSKKGTEILENCGLNRFRGIDRIYVDGFSKLLNDYTDFRTNIKTHHFF